MTIKPHIFLDVDGVLNCPDTWRLNDGQKGTFRICPERTERMSNLMDELDVVVVMSSTWRKFSDHMDYLRLKAPRITARLHGDWRTPEYFSAIRGSEIAIWLEEHPEVTNWAIVDDDSDMLPEQEPRFVNTDWSTGFLDSHADELRHILTRKDSK